MNPCFFESLVIIKVWNEDCWCITNYRPLSPTLSGLRTKTSSSPNRTSAWIWALLALGSRTASSRSWIRWLRTMKTAAEDEILLNFRRSSSVYYKSAMIHYNLACFIAAEINNLSVSAIFFYPVRLYFLLIKLRELGQRLISSKSLLIQIYLL